MREQILKKYALMVVNLLFCICFIVFIQGTDIYAVAPSGTLPVMYIHTEDNEPVLDKTHYKSADLTMTGADASDIQYRGKIQIKGRANTSWEYPKKPYKIKLDNKTNLLGLGKSKEWVLLANYLDEALIRTELAVEIGKNIGIDVMNGSFVEVMINGEYLGCYYLSQQICIDKSSLDIFDWNEICEKLAGRIAVENYFSSDEREKLKNRLKNNLYWISSGKIAFDGASYLVSDYMEIDDSLKGFLFESSAEYDESQRFKTKSGYNIMVKNPKNLATNPQLYAKVVELWNSWDEAINSYDGYNSEGKHYSEISDIDSCVKFFLVNEIVGNRDARSKSRYSYIDEGLLTFGPIWDFDWSLGMWEMDQNPKGWKIANSDKHEQNYIAQWMDDPFFLQLCVEKYHTISDYLEYLNADGGYIDKCYEKLKIAGSANEQLWYVKRGFEVDTYKIKEFFSIRLKWLNIVFDNIHTLIRSLNKTNTDIKYFDLLKGDISIGIKTLFANNAVIIDFNGKNKKIVSYEISINGKKLVKTRKKEYNVPCMILNRGTNIIWVVGLDGEGNPVTGNFIDVNAESINRHYPYANIDIKLLLNRFS